MKFDETRCMYVCAEGSFNYNAKWISATYLPTGLTIEAPGDIPLGPAGKTELKELLRQKIEATGADKR